MALKISGSYKVQVSGCTNAKGDIGKLTFSAERLMHLA